AATGSRAIVIVPLLVTIVAVYCRAASMHMGGGASNLRRVGLEPSVAGHSVGGMSSFRAGGAQASVIVTLTIWWTVFGWPCGVPSASIFCTTSSPWVTWPKSE